MPPPVCCWYSVCVLKASGVDLILLFILVFHFHRVSKEEEHNKMTPNSLAIVFAPCLLRSPDVGNPLLGLQDVSKTTMWVMLHSHASLLSCCCFVWVDLLDKSKPRMSFCVVDKCKHLIYFRWPFFTGWFSSHSVVCRCVEILISEQLRRYNEKMENIQQLEYAEALAVNQLKLRRQNTVVITFVTKSTIYPPLSRHNARDFFFYWNMFRNQSASHQEIWFVTSCFERF